MNKILTFFVMFFLLVSQCIANPYTSFSSVLDTLPQEEVQKSLDVFTKDFGQTISGGSCCGIGAALGLLGVYGSLKVSYRTISKDNIIVKDTAPKGLFFPMLHFCVGLPYDFNAILRFSRFDDTTVIGAGLLYELFKPKTIIVPAISLQSVYNDASTNAYGNEFKAWNLKNSILLQFSKVPFIKPYIGLNYDITHLKAYSSKYCGIFSDVYGFGYGAGLNASLGIFSFAVDVFIYEDRPTYNLGMFVGF
ncbi:MAG: hypothetical protein LBU10_02195 [Endomicrobium sp.]|nr:hypothetical protein [Endomicrobium sp.]